jgi:hypothetical protein
VKTGSNLVVIGGVIVVAIAGVAQPTAVAASNSGMGFDPAIHLSAPSYEQAKSGRTAANGPAAPAWKGHPHQPGSLGCDLTDALRTAKVPVGKRACDRSRLSTRDAPPAEWP